MVFLRHLDLVLLALALPVFVAAGFPLLGWCAAALAWAAWRGLGAYATRKAAEQTDPRRTVGIMTGSMIGRGWLVAIIIFGAGLIENDAGLAAAVLAILLFTAFFTVSMILRPFEQQNPEQPA